MNLRRAAGYDYFVYWDTLRTPDDLNFWVWHLSQKKWGSDELIRELKQAYRERRQSKLKRKGDRYRCAK